MTFKELDLIEPILRSLDEEGYETPTPIQAKAIPHALKGRDLLGCAQTGTGKTAAFSIPILQLLQNAPDDKHIKALVLTPTRELAIQIEESLNAYGRHLRLRSLVIFGGVSQKPQEKALRQGVDILVATPGRLLDLMNQGFVDLRHVQHFVLDEADRMLDMGFINDVKKVIQKIPEKRQTLFFSATMPPEIAELANRILTDPLKVEVAPPATTVEKIEQAVYFVEKNQKRKLLEHLLHGDEITNALVFSRTKHGANRIVKELLQHGVDAMAIHGNKSQVARQKALGEFKDGKLRVLVATDIAARGIDIDGLSHVINYDLPNIPESYVHRIGRTGRAGAEGVAISFCDFEEAAYLQDIQKLIGLKVPVVTDHPFPLEKMPDFSRKLIPPKLNQREPRDPREQRNQRSPRGGRNDRRQDNGRNAAAGQGRNEDRPQQQRPPRPEQGERTERPEGGTGEQRRLNWNKNRNRPNRGSSGGQAEGGARNENGASNPSRDENRRPNPPRNDDRPPRNDRPRQDDNEPKKKTEEAPKDDRWARSSSIFKETPGKKGFAIFSDRNEKSRNNNQDRGRRRPPTRGGKR